MTTASQPLSSPIRAILSIGHDHLAHRDRRDEAKGPEPGKGPGVVPGYDGIGQGRDRQQRGSHEDPPNTPRRAVARQHKGEEYEHQDDPGKTVTDPPDGRTPGPGARHRWQPLLPPVTLAKGGCAALQDASRSSWSRTWGRTSSRTRRA